MLTSNKAVEGRRSPGRYRELLNAGKMSQQFEISDGEVRLWIDQESLHLRATDAHGDPVELTKEEAVKLAQALLDFSEKIDS